MRSLIDEGTSCLIALTSDFELLPTLDDIAALVPKSYVLAVSSLTTTKNVKQFQRKRHLIHMRSIGYEVIMAKVGKTLNTL